MRGMLGGRKRGDEATIWLELHTKMGTHHQTKSQFWWLNNFALLSPLYDISWDPGMFLQLLAHLKGKKLFLWIAIILFWLHWSFQRLLVGPLAFWASESVSTEEIPGGGGGPVSVPGWWPPHMIMECVRSILSLSPLYICVWSLTVDPSFGSLAEGFGFPFTSWCNRAADTHRFCNCEPPTWIGAKAHGDVSCARGEHVGRSHKLVASSTPESSVGGRFPVFKLSDNGWH